MITIIIRILIVTLSFYTASCATVNFDHPKEATYKLTKTDTTYLGEQLKDVATQHPNDHSGFYILSDGIEALSARLLMAEQAERSIDAQYYLIKNDITGHAFIAALLRAADRGVRVRLLIDDFFTNGYDAGMFGLNSHPNFEIRVFNPFANRAHRYLDALTSFSRINRRMHNKSFTVDNQLTIIGGRNIGDEYFGANEDTAFYDIDVAAIGPVVNNVSNMFDKFSNFSLSLSAMHPMIPTESPWFFFLIRISSLSLARTRCSALSRMEHVFNSTTLASSAFLVVV